MILSDKKDRTAIMLLFVLSVVCYWKIFDNYLYLDDTMAVFAGYLLSLDVMQILSYRFSYIDGSALRRVMVALSYVPNYLLSGRDPWSYYLVSLSLHFGNSVLAYLIVKKLSGKEGLALLVSFLFCASLNKADAVIWIAHRNGLMGAFFQLLSLLFYIRIVLEGYSNRFALYSIVSFLFAIGSYETALVMPAVFVSLGLLYKGRSFFRKDLILINSVFAGVVLALALYLNLGATSVGGNVITESTFIGKAYHVIRNILSVFPSFIIPPFLLQDVNEPYHNVTAYFGWIETLSLILILSILLANRLYLKDRLLYFSLLFFFITAMPSASPRWAYFPMLYSQDIRWTIGKYGYLASFGFYTIAGILLYKLYCYLRDNNVLKRGYLVPASAILLSAYLIFNMYWIYERERMWDILTKAAKMQIDSLTALNLTPGKDTNVYVDRGFILYHNHARSLLRVIYDNPNLSVQDVRDYRTGTGKRNLLFFAEDEQVSALWSD